MVTLSKIYTKTGDDGTTGLGDGERRPKHDLRIAAYGDVDEANSCLGLFMLEITGDMQSLIISIQNDLFDLGADLCVPESSNNRYNPLRVTADQVTRLELAIDHYNESLPPLKSFVLPGGVRAAAFAHLARTVVRRAERKVTELQTKETINPNVATYLNRLSDLLFVLSRAINITEGTEPLWQPAKSQAKS